MLYVYMHEFEANQIQANGVNSLPHNLQKAGISSTYVTYLVAVCSELVGIPLSWTLENHRVNSRCFGCSTH